MDPSKKSSASYATSDKYRENYERIFGKKKDSPKKKKPNRKVCQEKTKTQG